MEIKCKLNYAMTLTGNNREERKRSKPFGYQAPVAGLERHTVPLETICALACSNTVSANCVYGGMTVERMCRKRQ